MMPPECQNCEMSHRIEMLEQDSQRNQQTHKDFYNRFENIGKEQARTDERYTQIKTDTAEIKTSLKQTQDAIQRLGEKPAKRWEGLVDKALLAVVGAVIVFLLTQIGIS